MLGMRDGQNGFIKKPLEMTTTHYSHDFGHSVVIITIIRYPLASSQPQSF